MWQLHSSSTQNRSDFVAQDRKDREDRTDRLPSNVGLELGVAHASGVGAPSLCGHPHLAQCDRLQGNMESSVVVHQRKSLVLSSQLHRDGRCSHLPGHGRHGRAHENFHGIQKRIGWSQTVQLLESLLCFY